MKRPSILTRRKTLSLSSLVAASLSGCLGSISMSSGPSIGESDIEMRIKSGNKNGPILDKERVELENISDDELDLNQSTLEYENGELYEFRELQLQPGAEVYVTTTGDERATMKSSPPIYVRGAGLDSLILSNSSAKVSLIGPEGGTIIKKEVE